MQETNSLFTDLAFGQYEIEVQDEKGCTENQMAIIKQGSCPIYTPNIISPNDDGKNDNFQIFSQPGFDGSISFAKVFDRWGNLVYLKENFQINELLWDGYYNGSRVESGVYVYVVEINHSNGLVENITGDLTLVY